MSNKAIFENLGLDEVNQKILENYMFENETSFEYLNDNLYLKDKTGKLELFQPKQYGGYTSKIQAFYIRLLNIQNINFDGIIQAQIHKGTCPGINNYTDEWLIFKYLLEKNKLLEKKLEKIIKFIDKNEMKIN